MSTITIIKSKMMNKSIKFPAGSEKIESIEEEIDLDDYSQLNLNGNYQPSHSVTELRENPNNHESFCASLSLEHRQACYGNSEVVQRIRQRHRRISVAQRTHIFFTLLKSRWSRSDSKESKKSTVTNKLLDTEEKKDSNQASDYAADYSSEHSRSSSATNSPAKNFLNHSGSPLARSTRSDKFVNFEDKNSDQYIESFFKTQYFCDSSLSKITSSNNLSQAIQQNLNNLDEVISSTVQDEIIGRRELTLRQHAFFQLRLHIRKGTNLVAMDRCGASDPYVKIKYSGRLLHKSRTVHRELNPIWDESVRLPIEDPFKPVIFKVFDYDWGLQDDFMGAASLDLRRLDLGQLQDITLDLKDPNRPRQYLGEIYISATLWPRNKHEKEQYFQRNSRLADVNRKLKSQIWNSVVTIVLVEAKNLLPTNIEGLSDPYVKFRLGNEKYKSKVVNKTLNPVWLEQFDLHLYENPQIDQELEITVWNRDRSHQDDLMGCVNINIAALEREKTHQLRRDFENGAGNIFLLLTISGMIANETISDLIVHDEISEEQLQIIKKYSLLNTFQEVREVGHLTVKVFEAQGLAAADLCGKSDPFCVLELVNSRLQTQTEYKTLAPIWQKIFTFNVKDINSVLEVTVYDEDRDHKMEFLGKIAIPLLKVQNGDKRWYALKDKKLRCRAKGNGPQILMELTVIWNVLRACIITLNPKEKKYMEPEVKFKRQIFLKNVLRLKAIIIIFIDFGKYIQSCWEWESKIRSIIALMLFIIVVYYFEPYMIPIAALLVLLKYYVFTFEIQSSSETTLDNGTLTTGEDDDDDDDRDKEQKKSLKKKLQTIQEVTQMVQNSMGYIASLCERVKNLFNFTVPFLSYLAILLAVVSLIILYLIPIRYLIIAWVVNKFARKIMRPHTKSNNEMLDLLSRVPDDEELLNYRELKPIPMNNGEDSTLETYIGRSGSVMGSTNIMMRRELPKRQKNPT